MISNLISWIVVGLIAGWATGKIMSGKGYGVLHDILLGMVGAVIGGWVMGILHIGGEGFIYTVIVAIGGACLLTFVVRKIRG